MDSLQQNYPLPLHPFPPTNGGTGATPTRQKEQLSGYILILQDDYRKVTFLNCLTGRVPTLVSIHAVASAARAASF
jgi:hypothetical protein